MPGMGALSGAAALPGAVAARLPGTAVLPGTPAVLLCAFELLSIGESVCAICCEQPFAPRSWLAGLSRVLAEGTTSVRGCAGFTREGSLGAHGRACAGEDSLEVRTGACVDVGGRECADGRARTAARTAVPGQSRGCKCARLPAPLLTELKAGRKANRWHVTWAFATIDSEKRRLRRPS